MQQTDDFQRDDCAQTEGRSSPSKALDFVIIAAFFLTGLVYGAFVVSGVFAGVASLGVAVIGTSAGWALGRADR